MTSQSRRTAVLTGFLVLVFLVCSALLAIAAGTKEGSTQVPVTGDPFGKYAAPVELRSVRSTSSSSTYPAGDDVRNNPYTRLMAEKLNVKVVYDWVVDQTQYETKLNTSIAAGAIPDFFSADSATFYSLRKDDRLADLTAAWDGFASEKIKAYAASFPAGMDSSRFNGKLLWIPRLGNGPITMPVILWMRSDWLEKSGAKAPTTIADLTALAQLFMKQNPGSYGIALQKEPFNTAFFSLFPLFNAYEAYPAIWVKDAQGKLAYGSIQPETKSALVAIQGMYAKGVFSPEFVTKDTNKVVEDVLNGKVGIEFGANWNSYYPFADAYRKDANAVWKPYGVPGATGLTKMLQSSWPVSSGIVVSKNCKNPEAVVKMVNVYMDALDSGMFKPDQYNGMTWEASPVYFDDPSMDYRRHVGILDALKTGSSAKLTGQDLDEFNNVMKWLNGKSADGYGTYFQRSPEGAHAIIRPYVDQNRLKITELRGAVPAQYANVKPTLDALELQTFIKIIMGGPISLFDEFVSEWKKLGGDLATQEVNQVFGR